MQASSTTQRRKAPKTENGDGGLSPVVTSPTTTAPVGPRPSPAIATVKRRKCGTSPFDDYWLNLDCCGLFCAGLTYALHCYGVYTVNFILIPPWFKSITDAGFYSVSLFGNFHRIAFTAVAILACYSHFRAMTTDPGAVPPDATPLPDPADDDKTKEDQEEGQIIIAPQQKGKRLCRRCKAFKPQRAHHCSVCKRCIIKMDHHCPWVNNCVALGNHKYFLLFVFYTFLSCLYSMTLVVFRFALCMHRYSAVTKKHVHCLERPSHLLYILGLVVEAMLFGLFTCCMMCDQWDVVWSNVTHIDRLKGDSAISGVTGITEVFGASAKPLLNKGHETAFRLDWLSPFGNICFPTGLKDDIVGYCRPCTNNSESELEITSHSAGRVVRSVTEIV